jgi:hypothetical protein
MTYEETLRAEYSEPRAELGGTRTIGVKAVEQATDRATLN